MDQIRRILRPSDVPDSGIFCDLVSAQVTFFGQRQSLIAFTSQMWADPEPGQRGWGENDRGISFTFGPDVVERFLAKHDLHLIW